MRRAVSSSPSAMLKPPSPVSATTGRVGRGERGADGARQAVADRGEAAVGDVVPSGRLGVVEQPGPVRGEAAIGDQDGVRRHELVELVDQAPDVDRALGRKSSRGAASRAMSPCAADLGGIVRMRGGSRLPSERSASRNPARPSRASPQSATSAARSGRTPPPRCRDGSSERAAAAARSAWSRSRRACSRPRAGSRRLRSGRWRCANSGRTGRQTADACRRSALAAHRVRDRDRCASASACSALQASERWTPPPASSSGRFALASDRGGALDIVACRAACGATAPSAWCRRRRNPPGRNRARHAPRLPARRARPGPAGPRSPPRRRGAPARGRGSSSRPGSAPYGRAQDIDLAALLRHVLVACRRLASPAAPPSACRH